MPRIVHKFHSEQPINAPANKGSHHRGREYKVQNSSTKSFTQEQSLCQNSPDKITELAANNLSTNNSSHRASSTCSDQLPTSPISLSDIINNARTRWPDFVDFIENSSLKDYLKGAKLHLNQAPNGEPLLPFNGQMQPWSYVKGLMSKDPSWNGQKIPRSWRFDHLGLRNISAGYWDHLIPTSKEPAHPGRWYLDLMTSTEGLNHAWVRLVDEKGNVFSIGMAGHIHTLAMFRGSVGRINVPDHREFFPEIHRQTRIAITKEEYERAINKVVQDQRDQNLYFNLLSRNCSVYASEVTQEAGVYLDNSEFASQALNRSLLKSVRLSIPKWLLQTIDTITYVARAILGTIANLFMGAWYEDSAVADLEAKHGHKWKVQPKKPFRSWSSFIDGTNFQLRSTFKIAEWQQFAERFRKERLEIFDTLKEECRKRLKHIPDRRFERMWADLRLDFQYEKPPELDINSLFLSDAELVSIDDITHRVNAWEKGIMQTSRQFRSNAHK